MDPGVDSDWIERIPKVELHLHLEGAIPLPALWELVRKYGDAEVTTAASLAARFVYRDFAHFIATWVWKNGFLRELEDFTIIAEAVALDLARQNIVYAEVFYSPGDFARHGLAKGALTEAIRRGLDRVAATEVALIADLVRDYGPERGMATLEEVAEVRDLGVIGIGIGGSEHAVPPEVFAPVFARARELGFHTTAHAGEAAGAESVWGAIRALRVERIGHGTRAAEDEALVEHLAATRLPLELCPLSNVCTGVVSELAAHPIASLLKRGLLVTVNTDDPAMFGNTLAQEYRELCETFGLGRATVRELVLNAVEASWLPAGRKLWLAGRIAAELGAEPDRQGIGA